MSDDFDLVIVGAGSAGLTGAGFAAKLGARVALVEKRRIGGDCTWTGCVPSKALIKAARVAHTARHAARYGVEVSAPRVDMARVRAYVRDAVAEVYAHETPEALATMGVTVILGAAEFVDAETIQVGGRRIHARRAIVCTGARPAIPPVAGLTKVPFTTYETLFDNAVLPAHLVVLGAGPIGLEMAQAYRRLGAGVTVVGEQFLPREEPEARAVIESVLSREGIRCVAARVEGVRHDGARFTLSTAAGDVTGDMLLVATGRRPNVEGLGLDRAGVEHSEHGIAVDGYLRTTAPHIYAAGDVLGGAQFTHLAGWQCFQAARNALLPGNARGVAAVLPAVTFVDPEVAHVGASEAEARAQRGDATRVHRWTMAQTDRARCDGEPDGFIKVVTDGDGTLLGATIVAARAGEMIAELALAIERRLTLRDVAATLHAYPTWSMAVQQLASEVAVAEFVDSAAGRLAVRLGRWGR